ncbi:MAG: hypothetical protein JWM57_220 [Phycisphaerales bacterium]|nr:hypothetical protein [Phycisphaerales bacterium]
MKFNDENLEFAVSQAVDGVLADHDRHALGRRLEDADALAFAADHEQINALLRANAILPPIDFEAFADRVSTAIEREELLAAAPLQIRPAAERPTWTRRLATAAAVMLVGAAAWPFLPHSTPKPAGPTGEAFVEIPAVRAPRAAGVTSITVGPSQEMVSRGMTAGLNPDAAKHQPRVVISSDESSGDVKPY